MYKVLLLSQENDCRSFLSIARSLGKKNIAVHSASNNKYSTPTYSRYITKKITLPAFSKNWQQNFIRLLQDESYTLVIPCDDLSIIHLQSHKDVFLKYTKIYFINEKAYDIVNNKHKTTQLAISLKINVPKSMLVEKKHDISNIVEQFAFPIVLKPISSFDQYSLERHNVSIIQNKSALETELKLMLDNHTSIQVQSFFSGCGVAISLLAKDGEILVTTQHKRLHEPFSGGGSSYRKSMEIDPQLYKAAKKIITHLNYSGVAMIEFKYNIETNQWVLLEINGRFWGSLPLAISAGVDYPYLLFLTLINHSSPLPKIKYNTNVYQRNLELDMYWLNDALFNVEKNELAAHGYTHKALIWETFRILSFKDNVDSFSFSDPLPFFMEVCKIINHIFYMINKKIRHKLLKNKFIRRQIKKKLISKLSKSNNILFICKGNICRSPFAQQAAIKSWPSIKTIKSSGYHKENNRSSPSIAIESACVLDINLSNHLSSVLNLNDIKNADIIFYFDEENRAELFNKFALYKKKMYALNLLSEKLSVEIEDPIDENKDGFLKSYTEIHTLLKSISINK